MLYILSLCVLCLALCIHVLSVSLLCVYESLCIFWSLIFLFSLFLIALRVFCEPLARCASAAREQRAHCRLDWLGVVSVALLRPRAVWSLFFLSLLPLRLHCLRISQYSILLLVSVLLPRSIFAILFLMLILRLLFFIIIVLLHRTQMSSSVCWSSSFPKEQTSTGKREKNKSPMTQLSYFGRLPFPLRSANRHGETPLHQAIMRANLLSVQLLVQCGADPTILSKYDVKIRHWGNSLRSVFSYFIFFLGKGYRRSIMRFTAPSPQSLFVRGSVCVSVSISLSLSVLSSLASYWSVGVFIGKDLLPWLIDNVQLPMEAINNSINLLNKYGIEGLQRKGREAMRRKTRKRET